MIEEVADDFVEQLVAQGEAAARSARARMEGVFLGPLHSERQRAEIEEQVADARSSGEVLTGGARPEGEHYEQGFFYEPTIVLEPARDSRVATRGGLRAGAADLEDQRARRGNRARQ